MLQSIGNDQVANIRAAIDHAGTALLSVVTELPAGDLINVGRALFGRDGPAELQELARSVEQSLSEEIDREHGGLAATMPVIATLCDLLQQHGCSLRAVIEQHDLQEASVAAVILKDGRELLIGLDAAQLSLVRKLLEATYRRYLAQKDLLFEFAPIAIRALFKRIGKNEERIERVEREFERLKALAAPAIPFTIPKPVTYFKGYEDERAAVRSALTNAGAAAISALYGIGGAGKSELARKVAADMVADFPDGQIFVEMNGTTAHPLDVSGAMSVVVAALGVKINLKTLHADYHSTLKGKRVLIIFDNVVNDAGLEELLRPGPPTTFLVTSRTRLALGVKSLELERLSRDAAKALLAEFVPSLDGYGRDKLAELCCDLPLALRAAGAYLAVTGETPEAYIAVLERRRLHHLAQSAGDIERPDLDPRYVLGLSYDRLAERHPAIARSFAMLSIFPAGFDINAASAILDLGPDKARRHLAQLTRRSLAQQESDGRYRIHDLLKELGLDKLAEKELRKVGERHAEFFVQRLRDMFLDFFERAKYKDFFIRFNHELPNFALSLFVLCDPNDVTTIALLQKLGIIASIAGNSEVAQRCYSLAVPSIRHRSGQNVREKPLAAAVISDYAIFLYAHDRAHEGLAAIDEAIACYEDNPQPWNDRYNECLARTYAIRADCLEAVGFFIVARKSSAHAIRLMAPSFFRRPSEMARWIFPICVKYRERCAKRGVEPDAKLIGPIEAKLAPLQKADAELFESFESDLAPKQMFDPSGIGARVPF